MPSPLQQRRAEILLLARNEHGLTQQELADRAGVSRSTVQNYENPKYYENPQRNLLFLICRVLDLDTDATMEGRFGDEKIHSARGPQLQAWLEEYGGWLSELSPTERREEMARVDARREYIASRKEAG